MIRSLLALILLTSFVFGAEEPKVTVFRSKDGKFSVTMPDKPTEKTNKVKTAAGEVEAHLFLVNQKDGTLLVSYSDYPAVAADGVEKVLAGVVEGNVKSLKGKLASEEKITLGTKKHPGREIRVEVPDSKRLYRAKLFLVGNRLYQVVVLGSDEFAKSKPVEDFLKSFAIDE